MNILPGWLRLVRQFIDPSILVLMYHRITDVDFDPWDLCVSPNYFEEQLQWIQKTNHVLSVSQLIDELQLGVLTKRAVVLTFDDGYADNFSVAKPLLEKYGIPATFFLTTNTLIDQRPFWWDELQAIVCQAPVLPQHLSIRIADEYIEFDLAGEALLTPHLRLLLNSWKASSRVLSKRTALYLLLWQKLKPLTHHEQQHTLKYLRDWADLNNSDTECPAVLSLAQLQELVHHPLIEIGVHTESHPALAEHSPAIQHQEIINSKTQLEKLCKRPLQSFAYPYGNYNGQTQELLKKENFSIAFTTQAKPVTNRSNQYQIGRIQVLNCTGRQLQKQLSNLF